MVNGPRPPLLRVKSEPVLGSADVGPQTPLQRVLSRVPTFHLEIEDGEKAAADWPASPDSPSPPPLTRRRSLSFVITHRRAQRSATRTTISVPLALVQRALAGFLLLALAGAAHGLVVGGGMAHRPRTAHARTADRTAQAPPPGWASLSAGGSEGLGESSGGGPKPALALLLDERAPLRARIGLVRSCFGVEHTLDLDGFPRWLLSQLTEAACAIAFPVAFSEVRRWRELHRPAATAALRDSADELQAALTAALPRGTRFTVDARYKTSRSLFEKLFLRGKEHADDALGLRVVIDEPRAVDERLCYEAGKVVGQLWALTDAPTDYIAEPKCNGYRSLHLDVELRSGAQVEVQVRTRHMHRVAEKGSAAHGRYKLGRYKLGRCKLGRYQVGGAVGEREPALRTA